MLVHKLYWLVHIAHEVKLNAHYSLVRYSVERCHLIEDQDVIECETKQSIALLNSVSCSSIYFPTQHVEKSSFLRMVHLILKHG